MTVGEWLALILLVAVAAAIGLLLIGAAWHRQDRRSPFTRLPSVPGTPTMGPVTLRRDGAGWWEASTVLLRELPASGFGRTEADARHMLDRSVWQLTEQWRAEAAEYRKAEP